MELDLYFVQENILENFLLVWYVPNLDQIVDIFTKPLSTIYVVSPTNHTQLEGTIGDNARFAP